jgi:hypothetical protein
MDALTPKLPARLPARPSLVKDDDDETEEPETTAPKRSLLVEWAGMWDALASYMSVFTPQNWVRSLKSRGIFFLLHARNRARC